MCLGVFLLGFILSGTLCFLDWGWLFSFHVREVFNYYLFKYFLRSFLSLLWDTYDVNVVSSQRSLRPSTAVFISFHSLFCILFCGSDFHHSVLQVIYPFFCYWFLLECDSSLFVCSLVLVVVQGLSHVQLFVTLCTAACQASLSFTLSWSLLKLMSIESVMPSNHLILFCPLLLPLHLS